MTYFYDSLSDLTAETLKSTIKEEAIVSGGELKFRGKSYSEWYELAFDAFESWTQGDKWGRLFEKIGEQLEEMDFDRTLSNLEDIY